jgi:hypothetical protein
MSISHVVSWYNIGNPLSWAIYLSIAIEIFALASVSAASIKISKGSIWFLFAMVTLIQLIGNVYYEYQEISITESGFLSWVELVTPWFDDWSVLDHKRFLALIQGGTLPIMSLTSLHFYIQFNENSEEIKDPLDSKIDTDVEKAVTSEEKSKIIVDSFEPSSDTVLNNNTKDDNIFESGSGLPVNFERSIKSDKGNDATKAKAQAQAEIKMNPKTGKLYKDEKNEE